MNPETVPTAVVDETDFAKEPSKFQKMVSFVKRNRYPVLFTATAVTGLGAGWYLRDKNSVILEETRDILESTADKIDEIEDRISSDNEE